MGLKERAARVKGLLFDWDGTIINSYEAVFQAHRYAYATHLGKDFPQTREDIRQLLPMRLLEGASRYAGEHYAAAVAESYLWFYTHEGYKLGQLYSGMREVLEELRRRGYALGVVTNTSRRRIHLDINHLEVEGIVDIIVTSDDTTERKPHPAPLLKGAEKLHIEPACLAYIGDYQGDIQAARAAGMVSIAGLWGEIFPASSLLAEHPDYTASRPEDLLEIFEVAGGC